MVDVERVADFVGLVSGMFAASANLFVADYDSKPGQQVVVNHQPFSR